MFIDYVEDKVFSKIKTTATESLVGRFPNIFFTTSALRDYHYVKQKNNAYYHIQAINLPFQNIEFYYLDKELKKWKKNQKLMKN